MSSVVLGGGIAGLSACYYLSRIPSQSVTLLEGTSRLGGWIKSVKNPNGTVYEAGPRTMRLAGVAGEFGRFPFGYCDYHLKLLVPIKVCLGVQ